MSPSDEYFRSYPNHHDVFISYAQLDKPIADAVCAKLESRHLRCWIAPRDVVPGKSFPEAIIDGIVDSRVVVLIFSSHANNSPHVIRELTTAVNKGRIIVPFRVEDVMPSKSMEYLISVPHWLDAITPPLEKHIDELAGILERILLSGKEPGVCSVCKTPLSPNAGIPSGGMREMLMEDKTKNSTTRTCTGRTSSSTVPATGTGTCTAGGIPAT